MVLGVLREAGKPMRRDDVVGAVNAHGRSSSDGTIGNAGTHLDEAGSIQRSAGLWSLRDSSTAPILSGSYLWAAPAILTHYEVAAWRREAILHILESLDEGVTRGELVARLTESIGPKFSASPEVVKADLDSLVESNKARLVGKQWLAVAAVKAR